MLIRVGDKRLCCSVILVLVGACGGQVGSGEGHYTNDPQRSTGGAVGQTFAANAGAGTAESPTPMAGAGGYTGVSNAAGTAGSPLCLPLIDDMEDGSGRIRRCSERIGVWYAFNETADQTSGSQTPAPTSPGVPILPVEIPGGRGGSKRAMHTSGASNDYRWWAGIGIDLAFDGVKYGLYDASAYDGITFWVRGSAAPRPLQFRIGSSVTTIAKYGGACSLEFCDPHEVAFEARADWHQRWVPFAQAMQSVGPIDRKALTNLQFYCEYGCSAFDFWIDDVAFYRGEPDCCSNPPGSCQGELSLKDTVLGASLNQSKVTSCEVCTQSQLSLVSYATANTVGDLTGLGCYVNLNSLTVSGWPVDDIGVISELRELDTIQMTSTLLADARPLAQLPFLRTLDLSANQFTRSENLSGKWHLTRLNLSRNQLTELVGLAGMRELVTLDLSQNAIADLDGIRALTALTSLDLSNNQLTDLTPLANLRSLNSLNLSNNQITDLSPLARLTSLSTLMLSKNQIVDLTPLSALTQLTVLRLENNRIQDTRPLLGLTRLTELLLDHNSVNDLGGLAEMTLVSTLSLNDNAIDDLRPLLKLTKVKSLDLSRNRISDAAGLPPNLEKLMLNENRLTSLTSIAPLPKLDSLTADNNQIAELLGVVDLPRLARLSIAHNQVSDLAPLANSGLHNMDATDNQISDLTPIVALKSLNPYGIYIGGAVGGITSYGSVAVAKNPIDCASQAENLAALRARNVWLYVDCP